MTKYTGMVEQDKIYALRMNIPWTPIIDPGPHHTVNPAVIDDENKQGKVIYNANKKVFDSKSNIN